MIHVTDHARENFLLRQSDEPIDVYRGVDRDICLLVETARGASPAEIQQLRRWYSRLKDGYHIVMVNRHNNTNMFFILKEEGGKFILLTCTSDYAMKHHTRLKPV